MSSCGLLVFFLYCVFSWHDGGLVQMVENLLLLDYDRFYTLCDWSVFMDKHLASICKWREGAVVLLRDLMAI